MRSPFSILKKNSDGSISHIGTGFLVSHDGIFVSAGHVFHLNQLSIKNAFCAFPSNKATLIELISLKVEYVYFERQQCPTYQDLAFGRLKLDAYPYYKIETQRPVEESIHTITGLVSITKPNRYTIKTDGTLDLSKIEPDVHQTVVVKRTAIITNDSSDTFLPEDKVDNSVKFNNVITLKRSAHHGSSGCPVLNSSNKVIGLYFGGPDDHQICHAITSLFITKRLRKSGYSIQA